MLASRAATNGAAQETICNKNSFYAWEHMGIDVAFSSFPPHAGSKWDELISEKIHSDISKFVRSKLWQIDNHSLESLQKSKSDDDR